MCISSGLGEPDQVCAPGYYCIAGALRVDPKDGGTGDECPIGNYCPGNTSTYLPCEPGSYRLVIIFYIIIYKYCFQKGLVKIKLVKNFRNKNNGFLSYVTCMKKKHFISISVM